MNRRNARIAAILTLFEHDMRTLFNLKKADDLNNGAADDDAAHRHSVDFAASCIKEGEIVDDTSLDEQDLKFADALFAGTQKNLAAIDGLLAELSRSWKLGRMVAIDRAILRLAVFELKFTAGKQKAPVGAVIDEAVSIAKIFGTDKSGKFVNGILSDVLKTASPKAEENPPA